MMENKFEITYYKNLEIITLEFNNIEEALEQYESLKYEKNVKSANLELVTRISIKSFL